MKFFINKSKTKDKIIVSDNKKVGNKKKIIDADKFKEIMNLDVKDLKRALINMKKNNKVLKIKDKKRKVVVFDIGSKSIKIAQGMYYKKNITIDKLLKVETPQGVIKDGDIVNKGLLVNKLKNILVENSIKADYGICTNNSSSIINREITIPKVENDEIETVVRFEIQQYLPINLDDYVIQTSILEETEDNKLDVRVIAYPEKMARSYYDILKELNLKPYALDVNYNSLNKLTNNVDFINTYEYNKEDSVVFIDMGAESIDVNIYNAGILRFTRIIKAGGVYIDELLNGFIDDNNFEEYKMKDISLKEDEIEGTNIGIINEIDDWIEKIEKVIQFYSNKNKDKEISKIFIYGGSAKIKGLSDYMTKKLSINTERIKSIPKITLNYKEHCDNVDDYMNVTGAMMRI